METSEAATRAPLRERVGEKIGAAGAPLIAAVSSLRHARMFHPDGLTFVADVAPAVEARPEFRDLARRLRGHALARFSGALWRRGFEHLDVLGIALRFRRDPVPSVVPLSADQDLLFATILSPFSMGFAPFTTSPRDFFANTYWAVSPFEIPGGKRVKFRLVAVDSVDGDGGPREERLRDAVERGHASWRLDVRPVFSLRWSPLARIILRGPAFLDEEALRFSPFRDGLGIIPRGLVHAMRRPTYEASQHARPHASETH